MSLKQEVADLKKLMLDVASGGKGNAAKGDKGKGKGKGKTTKGKDGGDARGGKGKGAGKSGSKGKGNEAWWPCCDPRCEVLMGKVWLNPPTLDQCGQCSHTRGTAPAVWEAQRDALRAEVAAEAKTAAEAPTPPATSKRQLRRQKAAERKKWHEEQEEAQEGESEDDSEDEDEQLPTEKELEESLKILTSPQPLKQGWSAEDVVNDETAQAATQSLATLRKEQASCAKVIQMVDGGVDIAGLDISVTRAKHASLEKAIVKATKDAPTVGVNAAQLRLDREVYLKERGEKLDIVKRGASNAQAHWEKARGLHQKMLDHWSDKMKTIEEEERIRKVRFEERNTVHEDRHKEVLEEFDKRISAAVQVAEEAAKIAQGGAQIAQPMETEQEKGRKKEEADAASDAAKEAFRRLNATGDISKEDLPNLDGSIQADKEALPVLARMYYWARASALGDSFLPYTFKEMGATAEVALSLVGEKAWKAMFKEDADAITDIMICPMQMRQIMFFQFMAYDGALRADKNLQDQEVEAQKALEEAGPRLKRMRLAMRNRDY